MKPAAYEAKLEELCRKHLWSNNDAQAQAYGHALALFQSVDFETGDYERGYQEAKEIYACRSQPRERSW